jgi:hypothetical protein
MQVVTHETQQYEREMKEIAEMKLDPIKKRNEETKDAEMCLHAASLLQYWTSDEAFVPSRPVKLQQVLSSFEWDHLCAFFFAKWNSKCDDRFFRASLKQLPRDMLVSLFHVMWTWDQYRRSHNMDLHVNQLRKTMLTKTTTTTTKQKNPWNRLLWNQFMVINDSALKLQTRLELIDSWSRIWAHLPWLQIDKDQTSSPPSPSSNPSTQQLALFKDILKKQGLETTANIVLERRSSNSSTSQNDDISNLSHDALILVALVQTKFYLHFTYGENRQTAKCLRLLQMCLLPVEKSLLRHAFFVCGIHEFASLLQLAQSLLCFWTLLGTASFKEESL